MLVWVKVENPARSCDNLNFCFPAQTEPFYWLRSQCSLPNLFWKVAWYFLAAYDLRQLGRKIQMFTTSCGLPDLHNNSFTFLKSLGLYKNASLKRILSHCVYLQEERNLGKYVSWSFWGQHARANMHREGQNLTLQVNFSYRKRATPKIETIFLEFSKAKVIYRMSHQKNDNF